MIDINKLEQAALTATQGEWISNTNGAVRTVSGDESTRGRARWQGPFRQADADFIAQANPSAVIELINRLRAAEKDAAYKQAKIDELMLEYCPEEITDQQLETWAVNQERQESEE